MHLGLLRGYCVSLEELEPLGENCQVYHRINLALLMSTIPQHVVPLARISRNRLQPDIYRVFYCGNTVESLYKEPQCNQLPGITNQMFGPLISGRQIIYPFAWFNELSI